MYLISLVSYHVIHSPHTDVIQVNSARGQFSRHAHRRLLVGVACVIVRGVSEVIGRRPLRVVVAGEGIAFFVVSLLIAKLVARPRAHAKRHDARADGQRGDMSAQNGGDQLIQRIAALRTWSGGGQSRRRRIAGDVEFAGQNAILRCRRLRRRSRRRNEGSRQRKRRGRS